MRKQILEQYEHSQIHNRTRLEESSYEYSVRKLQATDAEQKKLQMAKIEWTIRGAELVESSIKQKLVCFPKVEVVEEKNLYNLVDIAVEIDSLKRDEQFSSLFASYDSSAGRVLLWVNFHISYNKIGLIKQADTKRNRTWLPRPYISSQASWNKWQEWKMIPLLSMKTQNHISQNLKLRLIPFLWQKVDCKPSTLRQNQRYVLLCYVLYTTPLQERLQFLRNKWLCFMIKIQ